MKIFIGIWKNFHGHRNYFSWASKYFSMGMEIYNDGQRDFSVAQWDEILTAVKISPRHSENFFVAQWKFFVAQ